MAQPITSPLAAELTSSFEGFCQQADYSLLEALNADPEASTDGSDHSMREVFSGHYVPVTPTPIPAPEYVAHSQALFAELGLSEVLAHDERFRRLFSGDSSVASGAMRPYGWATGYALSIYGTEYIQQCPFGTGNGYGDGRAISIFEGQFQGKRWEMQLKGGGPTPYCRGADGRAVLRSSVREFLAQELMHALGVPTSRSLTLYMSRAEAVRRPWYSEHSRSYEPDVMVNNPAAISTRVAPSFLRVGQLELFARRARSKAHPGALRELQMLTTHLIERNYRSEINAALPFHEQVLELARLFRGRLSALVANWMRVGFCQGNFNSDNCAAGGFTLDYGPFGFCELFDPRFQPWTGGGEHFCFFNQPAAAEVNYGMFIKSLRPLLEESKAAIAELETIEAGFADVMAEALDAMWSRKLGLPGYNSDLVNELLALMLQSKLDYTSFFRRLSLLPESVEQLKASFYVPSTAELDQEWQSWLQRWHSEVATAEDPETVRHRMEQANPAITWREWLIAPAYQQAAEGNNALVHELQTLFNTPYTEPEKELKARYDRLRPREYFSAGGISHYSCSS